MIDDFGATTPRLTTLCVVDDGLITASMIKRMVFVRYNLSREYSRSTLTFSGFVTPPGHGAIHSLSCCRVTATLLPYSWWGAGQTIFRTLLMPAPPAQVVPRVVRVPILSLSLVTPLGWNPAHVDSPARGI